MSMRKDLFVHTLNQLEYGKAADLCSEELHAVIMACRDTAKPGEIILKIKVSPDAHGRYKLSHSVSTKKPAAPTYATILWGTPEGNLQRTDPAQGELEFKEVQNTPSEIRVINDELQVKQL